MAESPFKLKIGLSVLNLLGPNLYSNIAAVLSEMVANAWDASASVVTIDINPVKDEITISDNGLGMSLEDINEKYLNIGFLKRKQEISSFTQNGRHVMGRKGIGKLATFSFAREMNVISDNGIATIGCKLDWEDIENAIENNTWYNPI
jgi:HSP90 family molecular chaperone